MALLLRAMLLGSIVLAGGVSRRMGEPKEALAWRDGSLLLHMVVTLLDCSYPVVVVARDRDQELPPLHTECELCYDSMPGCGPLCALEAGMQFLAGKCDAAVVTGCDHPFLDSATVAWLADSLGEYQGVVPRVGGELQPLTAVYRLGLLPTLKEMLVAGERRAQALAETAGIRVLEEDEVRAFDQELRFLRNLNTREDYRRALDDAGA